MTRCELITALTGEMSHLLKGYSLPSRFQGVDGIEPSKQVVMQEVKVFGQYLPQPSGITFADKNTGMKNYAAEDYESNFPCVIVKLADMTDTEENSREHSSVNVSILAGVYDESPECQGYIDLLNLQEVIRKHLLEHRILAHKYLLKMPLESHLDESETWPVYFGSMSMSYELGRPVRDSGYVYRYGQP